MEMKSNILKRLNVCMLLPPLDVGERVNPQIGICSYLANFGHQITWILPVMDERQPRQFLAKSAKVYTVPYIRYLPGNSVLTRAGNKIPNTIKRMWFIHKMWRRKGYNLVFVRDDVFDGLLAVYIKRRYKVPFVYEHSGPLEEHWEGYKIEARKSLSLYYLVAKLSALVKIYIMKKADLVLPTTRWFEEGLVNKGISKSKLMPYPNGVDIELFIDKGGEDIRKRFRLGGSKVVIYIGAMNKIRNLTVLIEALARVKNERGGVKLLMVGKGTDTQNLERLATELGIKNEVIFTGFIPQSEIPNYIGAADIGISPVPPLSFFKVSSPIKTLEYMAMAKPVVANEEIFEHREVIKQSGGGVLVPYTPKAFAQAIIELLNDPEMAGEMGIKGREWVMENRSYEVLARRLEERYIQLIGGN